MEGSSHDIARERFSAKALADQYPSEYSNRWRDRREKACILECLKSIPAGAHVLDLPCGKGRLTRILVERGYEVTGADVSEAMLEYATQNYTAYRKQKGGNARDVKFLHRDVLCTGFKADEFSGITCIRLFHHFSESATRRQALAELRRICHGPIILTFLNSFALDRVTSWLKARLRGRKPARQLPITFGEFAADICAADLRIEKQMAAHWGISSRWFLVLERT